MSDKKIKAFIIGGGIVTLAALIMIIVLGLDAKTAYDNHLTYNNVVKRIKNHTSQGWSKYGEFTTDKLSTESFIHPFEESKADLMELLKSEVSFFQQNDVQHELKKAVVSLETFKQQASAKHTQLTTLSLGEEVANVNLSVYYEAIINSVNSLDIAVGNAMTSEIDAVKSLITIVLALFTLLVLVTAALIYLFKKRQNALIEEKAKILNQEKEKGEFSFQMVKAISEADFDSEIYDPIKDELTDLLKDLRIQLKSDHKEDEQRNWTNTGLAKFGNILGSHDNLHEMCDVLISELVKYLGVNQAGLFIRETADGEEYMELMATYAYQRKKFITKKIYPGEGLVGQCWLEGDTILLKEIPEAYVSITSGLGEALPNTLLIIPIKANEEVHGVIELAAFNDIPQYRIDFVENVCERIASVVANLKNSTFTKNLLDETKLQAEALQAQEEEMRQNMEELQATQEEMERVAKEMEGQIRVINSTMATIEFDITGDIREANDNFLKLMEYQKGEIIGKHHGIFVDAEYRESTDYKMFWKRLSQGEAFEGEFTRFTKTGKRVWIKGMYSPIHDQHGKLVKVVKFAYDITQEKEQRLQMSNVAQEVSEQLRIINAAIATIEFDLEGNIKDANDNFLGLMGYKKEEIVGKHHKIFVKKEDVESEKYWDSWKRLGQGESIQGEFERITKKGQKVWIRGVYSTVFDNEGNPVRVIKLAYDITREKLQQMEMTYVSKEMSEQMRVINSTLATVEFDLDGTITNANSTFLKLMKYERKEVINQHHRMFVSEEEASTANYRSFWKELGKGANFEGEFKRYNKDGEAIWIKGVYSCIKDNDGNPVRVIKFVYDITEEVKQREKIKREAKSSQEQLRLVNATIATVEFDLQGNVLNANDKFLFLMEYEAHEVIGKHHSMFVSNKMSGSKAYENFWKRLADGEHIDGEFRRCTKSGKEVWIKGIYSSVNDEKGNPIKVMKYVYDITNQKRQEVEIGRQLKELVELRVKRN
ncbi:PAS domain S-box protein [Fulvivirga ligni]|uniref:PAS domain S-box protein n=1 Tax=Fulvivirga ligni TaxID=2904246 RepID=UPI001F22C61A|nr:PAS domain S-box protein [Fulvivirga ligni]UII18949.1 PAS domain S-box protein [Fulvivirga ligni]